MTDYQLGKLFILSAAEARLPPAELLPLLRRQRASYAAIGRTGSWAYIPAIHLAMDRAIARLEAELDGPDVVS